METFEVLVQTKGDSEIDHILQGHRRHGRRARRTPGFLFKHNPETIVWAAGYWEKFEILENRD